MFGLKSSISYIWPVIKRYKWQFYTIFFLSTGRILVTFIINPLFYKKIIDLVSGPNIDRVALAHPLFHYVMLIAIALPVGWFFSRSCNFLVSKFQSAIIKDLHDFSFAKLQNHSYKFYSDNFSGSLVNKSRKFVRAFERMHDIILDNFWNTFVAFTAMFIVFLLKARSIAFIFLGMSVIYVFIIFIMSRKKMQYDIERAAADSIVTGFLADSITNILATKSSSATEREKIDFAKVTGKDAFCRLRAWYFGNKQNAIQSIILIAVQILAAFITANLWIHGQITAGMFLLVQSYTVMIGGFFWDLGKSMSKFTEAVSDMKEMVDIFKEIPDVEDSLSPEVCSIKDGAIEINNIIFDYATGNDVFHQFSLKINSGEKVGLVGHSGSGKSTITKLLMRFVDVDSGEILIDGQNIKNITQDDLRKNISYISQEPILFHRSIRDNIAYSRPDATEDEIIEVARKAHAHEFILELNHGYDTLVGERGVKLSGGERQRVAIARAMLKKTPILLLDEATSSLDSISESYIQDAFNVLMKDKTTIVIAHRLSTVQKMDRIIVLDHGKIVEEGTHKQLLKKNGFYADLWKHQTGGFLE